MATISDPRTFNPVVVQDAVSRDVTGAMFDGLIEQNYLTGEIEPALAESWIVGPNGRTWTFTLRQGIRWSDGRPVTIDDVVFSVDAIFTPGVDNSARSLLTFDGKPVKYRKLDDRRIQFTTEKVVGLFLQFVGAIDVAPKHKLQAALVRGGAEFTRTWGINTPPKEMAGTGPFLLQQYVPGQRVVMLRNPTYWKVDRKGQRLPYLTRYIILIVPNLEATRLKFLAKETDAYGARAREFAELKQLEKEGNFTVYDGSETFTSSFLVLNQNPAGVAQPKLSWFQDVRFRRALSHAIDRKTIVDQVFAGRGTAAWGPVSVGNKLYYNDKLPQYEYNLARAEQLLAEAGYRKGADGAL
ncbi:MAG: ABC transporter substrate-binding protein, partial [Armatimonadetes bacterium]|nr:ABC transporter substrate-binding protein [Armatimonadota bacterium]